MGELSRAEKETQFRSGREELITAGHLSLWDAAGFSLPVFAAGLMERLFLGLVMGCYNCGVAIRRGGGAAKR